MKVGEAFVEIRPDTGGFEAEANSKIGGTLKNLAKGAAVAFAAVAAKDFLSGAIAEAQEAAKVTAQTEAVIKSMGGVANVTADHVGKLAESLSNKTAIDDEAIQGAENLLLTFGKVRNEVGKGNNIFDQATEAAVDMSVALGTDAKGAALQVGKALNDPLKGITALTRAGVSFTEQQKDQIKAMVASGDTLGAQKLILSELTKQFGGSAAAAATPMDKLRVTFANFQETLGTALLPVINQVVGALSKFLPVVAPFLPILVPLGAAIAAIVVATKVWVAVQTALNVILTANPIGLIIVAIAALVAGIVIAYKNSETFRVAVDTVWTVLKNVATFIFGTVVGAFGAMSTAVSGVINFVRNNWPLLLAILTGPFGLAVRAIATHFDTIVGFVKSLPGRITGAIGNVGSMLYQHGREIIAGLLRGLKEKFEEAKSWVSGIAPHIAKLKGPLDYDRRLLVPAGKAIMDGLRHGLESQMGALVGTLGRVTDTISVGGNIGATSAMALRQPGAVTAGGAGPITVELVVDGKRFTAAIVDPMAEALITREKAFT